MTTYDDGSPGSASPAGSGVHDLAAVAAPEVGWHRLAGAMLFIQPVRELIRAIPLLIALIFAGHATGGPPWSLIGVALVTLRGVLMWFTTSFRITATQLQLRRGLLRRRTLVTQLDRVRTVDVTADVWQRFFHLTKVEIGTGTTDRRKEAFAIDGLGAERAQSLRGELLHRTPARSAADASTADPSQALVAGATETEIARLRPSWAAYGPFTLSGAFTALFLVGLGWRISGEAHLHPDQITVVHETTHHLEGTPWWLAGLEVLLPALLLIGLLSVCGYVLAFWNFRLSRHSGGTLHVERGLLTTRATSLEERRLRGAELSEPLLLRAVGGARCLAIATGLRVGRGAERGGTVLLPPAPRAEALRVAANVLHDGLPLTAPLRAHPPAARRRRFSRATVGALLIAAALVLGWWAGLVPSYASLVALVVLAPAWLLAADRATSLGHQVVSGPTGLRWLVTRGGSVVRRRCILDADGVIGVTLRESFFQRRAGVVTLVATTAAGRQRYAVTDLGAAQADALSDELLPGLLDTFLVGASPDRTAA
jgi:putative membrane protein